MKDYLFCLLGNQRTYWLLQLTWLLVIAFSCLALPPADDDGYFLETALGMVNWGYPVMYIGESLVPVFTELPGAFIFQAGFLWCLDLLGIPINLYTYRLFHIFTVTGLLLAGLRLIHLTLINREKVYRVAACSLFMVLLGITPFGQFGWALRPELLGLLFLTLGLVNYRRWDIDPTRVIAFWSSALWFGLAISVHPNFSFRAALLILVVLLFGLLRRRWISVFCYGLIASTPFAMEVFWYISTLPHSWYELAVQVNWKSAPFGWRWMPLNWMFSLASLQHEWGSKLINMVYALFWMPLLLSLLVVIFLWWRNGFRTACKDHFYWLLSILVAFECIRLLIPEGDVTLGYFNITAYFVVLLLVLLLFETQSLTIIVQPSASLVGIGRIALVGLVFMHSSIHIVKFSLFSTQYYNAYKMYETVNLDWSEDDKLFLMVGKLIPAFTERLVSRYSQDSKNQGPYRTNSHSHNPNWDRYLQKFIRQSIQDGDPTKMLWGGLKSDMNFNSEKNRVILSLATYGGIYLVLQFEIDKVIYEDKDNIIFRPRSGMILEMPKIS